MGGSVRAAPDAGGAALRGARPAGCHPAHRADRVAGRQAPVGAAGGEAADARLLPESGTTEPGMTVPVIAMEGVTKHFGGVQALRGVDFELQAGEIHALLGENGAGKSTLMSILSGVHAPDAGLLKIDGAPVRFASPRDAQAAGIATIFQELDLVPSLDVAANLFLGRELRRPGGFLDTRAMHREARKRLADIELEIDVERLVGDLSIGHCQVV